MPSYAVGRCGEYAERPSQIPRRGWWQILLRVKDELVEDRLSVVAAGISYYCLLSVFPGIAMFITIYGLLGDPETARQQIGALSNVMPPDAYSILAGQLESVTASASRDLGFGLALSFAIAAWSASRAIRVLMVAMNIAYEETETRSFVRLNLLALALTVGGACFVIISLSLIAAVPAAVGMLEIDATLATILEMSRWVALTVAAVLALAVLYRYTPNRSHAVFRWITPGAIVATVLWLLSSLLFSFYVTNFGNYNETFGSIGAVVVLLLWFYISVFAVCIGAELNAELERQTYRDTTTGPIRPIGRRGAYVADHTAEPVD